MQPAARGPLALPDPAVFAPFARRLGRFFDVSPYRVALANQGSMSAPDNR